MLIEHCCDVSGEGPRCPCAKCASLRCQCNFCIEKRFRFLSIEVPPGGTVHIDAGRCLIYVHYIYVYSR